MFGGFVGWDGEKGGKERARMRAKRAVYQLAAQGAALACKDFGGSASGKAPSNQPHRPFPATTATFRPPHPNHLKRYCPVHRLPFASLGQEKISAYFGSDRIPIVRTTDISNLLPSRTHHDNNPEAQMFVDQESLVELEVDPL